MRQLQVFFTIAQAAQILGVSPSSLRGWERMGLINPIRSQGRYRLYSREVLDTAKQVLRLRRGKGLNLAGIAHLLEQESSSLHKTKTSRRPKTQHIGKRLGKLRRQQKFTLSEAARRTGLSISFLSSLEHEQANPSIATLQRLAQTYKTNVLALFGTEGKEQRLVKARDREILCPHAGVQIELMALGNTLMEPHVFRIQPGATSGGSYHHEGEEFIHVLEGQIEIWLDEVERYVLESGDTLYFESTHAHRWRSLSDTETLLLWVNTPPTF